MANHLIRLIADYVATLALLARGEARRDMQHLMAALKRRAIGGALLFLGVLWINGALLILLLDSPYREIGPFIVGFVVLLAGYLALRSAPAPIDESLRATRDVFAAELNALGVGSQDDPHPRPEPTPAQAQVRLQAIRTELGMLLAPPEVPADTPKVQARRDAQENFVPRSRTMRVLMALWGGHAPDSRLGTVAGSLLGFVALRSVKLRRIVSVLALARNVTRGLGRRMRRA